MNGIAADLLRRQRRTAWWRAACMLLPWWCMVGAVIALHGRTRWNLIALLLLALVTALVAMTVQRTLSPAWWARHLNRHRRDMEDSAELLLGDAGASALAELQRARLQQRLRDDPHVPTPHWPHGRCMASLIVALLCGLLAWQWPRTGALQQAMQAITGNANTAGIAPPSLRQWQWRIDPPAYSGLASRTTTDSDIEVLERSGVQWMLQFDGAVRSAELQFADGTRLNLRNDQGIWRAQRRMDAPQLVRVVTTPALPAAQQRLHRITVKPDLPPSVRHVQPAQTLTLMRPRQSQWEVVFEAEDDIALAASATLRIVQTRGEGEQITFSERSLALTGEGNARKRRFRHVFALAGSGLTPGNDLIAQLTVRDTRSPDPHVVRSTALILRWPPERIGEATGLDALIQKQMPAYFRSQRQIIIDIEKLLREKPKLDEAALRRRSEEIGLDQGSLRMRYGQFMGEEAEGGDSLATDASDIQRALKAKPRNTLPTNDVDEEEDHEEAHDAAASDTAHAGHDHASGETPQDPFAQADALAMQDAHVHDLPEAATLLDPETRELLRNALRAMWMSEGALRRAAPAEALPHANEALKWIKQAQQSERIYLPRMGNELPPIDFSRRMSGKREGLAPRVEALQPRAAAPPHPLAVAWQALASTQPVPPSVSNAMAQWLQRNAQREGALAALQALDAWQRDPACHACRQRLRDRLWPLLPRATPLPTTRLRGDAVGDAYLDALGGRR